jgi:hypothetical protein
MVCRAASRLASIPAKRQAPSAARRMGAETGGQGQAWKARPCSLGCTSGVREGTAPLRAVAASGLRLERGSVSQRARSAPPAPPASARSPAYPSPADPAPDAPEPAQSVSRAYCSVSFAASAPRRRIDAHRCGRTGDCSSCGCRAAPERNGRLTGVPRDRLAVRGAVVMLFYGATVNRTSTSGGGAGAAGCSATSAASQSVASAAVSPCAANAATRAASSGTPTRQRGQSATAVHKEVRSPTTK